jgi:hypothetical protein
LYFVNINHFGINKLLLNVIATFFYIIYSFVLYGKSGNFLLNRILKNIVSMSLFINIILFILYFLYNKKNGLLGKTPIQIIIFQDFQGRFQGSFSEPSILGWYLGCMALVVVLIYKSKLKYIVSLVCLYILYFACQAKFVLIGLPASLLINIFFSKLAIKDIKPLIFFTMIIACFVALFIDNIMAVVYSTIAKYVEYQETGTFVTRFSFLLASFENIGKYPLGSGFGLNFEVFRDNMEKISNIGNHYGLYTEEIMGYLKNSRNFGSKETVSLIISMFGFIGFYILIKHFLSLYTFKYNHAFICKSLLVFIFLEIVFSMNIMGVGLLPVLFGRMSLNECRR